MKLIICPKIVRNEQSPKFTTFDVYRHDQPTGRQITYNEPTSVDAVYGVYGEIDCYGKKVDADAVHNAVTAYFILKGDNAINDVALSKFVKKVTGHSVKIHLTSVLKRYEFTARLGHKYKTESIYLLKELETNPEL